MFVPEVPSRVPADALAHVTTRPEKTHSCTRGHRRMSWISYRSTRRRIFPIPGTGWSRDQV